MGELHHLWMLRQGATKWNEWRASERLKLGGEDKPLLMGFHLREINLESYDMRNVNLQEAVVRGVSLQGVNLRGANLIRADLRSANLRGAWLDDRESDLRDADLRNADLWETLLDNADIRGARGVVLDSTRVRNARFSPTAKDPWSVLRRAYTGPFLLLNVLFLISFLVPYILKSVGWVSMNRAEQAVNSAVGRVAEKVEEVADGYDLGSQVLCTAADTLSKHTPNTENGWREYRLWQLIIGLDKPASYWVTALALIVYNLLRTVLTWLVAPLRDEEERSGHTPSLKPNIEKAARYLPGRVPSERSPNWILDEVMEPMRRLESLRTAYGWMVWPHRAVKSLGLLAFGAFLYHMWAWMMTIVLLPPV